MKCPACNHENSDEVIQCAACAHLFIEAESVYQPSSEKEFIDDTPEQDWREWNTM